jgi:hypothetical protein
MLKDTVRQIVNIIATILPIVIGTIVGSGVADASNRNPVLITPAGYTFAIWTLIFVATIAFAVYQALPSQRENPRLRRIGYWYAFANVCCAAWDLIFPRQLIGLSEIIIVLSLIALLMAYTRAGIHLVAVSRLESWLVDIPLSIFTAWVTFATVVNTAVFLKNLGWNGFGLAPTIWAAIILIVAALIVCAVSIGRRDIAYTAVGTWALLGVVVANLQMDRSSVALVAGILAALTCLVAIVVAVRRMPPSQQIPGNARYSPNSGR